MVTVTSGRGRISLCPSGRDGRAVGEVDRLVTRHADRAEAADGAVHVDGATGDIVDEGTVVHNRTGPAKGEVAVPWHRRSVEGPGGTSVTDLQRARADGRGARVTAVPRQHHHAVARLG